MILAIVSTRMQSQLVGKIFRSTRSLGYGGGFIAVSLDAYYDQGATCSLEVENVPMVNALRKWGNTPLWETNRSQKVLFFLSARFEAQRLISYYQPKLVILANDIGVIEQAIITTANNIRIPTLLVQDGILQSAPYEENDIDWSGKKMSKVKQIIRQIAGLNKLGVYGLGGCKKFAVMGAYTEKLLRNKGVPANRIVITGQPRFDDLIHQKEVLHINEIARNAFAGKWDLDISKKWFLYVSQPLVRYRRWTKAEWGYFEEILYEGFNMLSSEIQMVLKLHPSDVIEPYQNLLTRLPSARLVGEPNISSVLPYVDGAIVYTSTVSLEALILGKPVIHLASIDSPDHYGLVQSGALTRVTTGVALAEEFKKILSTEPKTTSMNAEKALLEHVGPMDGKATERVARLALQIANGGWKA